MHKIFITISLINFINAINGCVVYTDRPILEEFEDNNYKFPWLVSIHNKSDFPGVGYGSLVNMYTVLTSAKVVAKIPINDLIVVADCKIKPSDAKTPDAFCTTKKIWAVRYPGNFNPKDPKDEDWALLFLTEKFEVTKGANAVQLVDPGRIDDYDLTNCVVHKWTFMRNRFRKAALVTNTYHASLAEDNLGMEEDDLKAKLLKDFDCLLNDCNFKTVDSENYKDISFFGSPVSCPLREDPTKYFQAGLSTIVYRYDYPTKSGDLDHYEVSSGTLVDLSPQVEDIRSFFLN